MNFQPPDQPEDPRDDEEIWEEVLLKSKAVTDVIDERIKQILAKGYSLRHDDGYTDGELAIAATCYAAYDISFNDAPSVWPWGDHAWKPEGRRQNLVRATALLIAEIQRLDRLTVQSEEPRL